MNQIAEHIKETVTMADLCRKYGLEVNRGGYMVCPFHAEKTASLKVYPKSFHCFGCGAGGTVIDFAMRYFNLNFKGAAARLDYDFGLHLPHTGKLTYREKNRLIQAQRARKLEAERRMLREQKLEQEHDRLCSLWQLLDAFERLYKPFTPEEALHPLFVLALQEKRHYEYLLDEFEERRRNNGRPDRGDSSGGPGVDQG